MVSEICFWKGRVSLGTFIDVPFLFFFFFRNGSFRSLESEISLGTELKLEPEPVSGIGFWEGRVSLGMFIDIPFLFFCKNGSFEFLESGISLRNGTGIGK